MAEKRRWDIRKIGLDKIAILLVAGLVLIFASLPSSSDKEETKGQETQSSQENAGLTQNTYLASLEQRLAQILSQVEGAGQVEVMITLKASSQLIVQEDVTSEKSSLSETDSSGGSRSQIQENLSGSTVLAGNSPYVIQEIMPLVEGVVVVATGADSASVKAEITAAVQALFPLEIHKIRVLKRGS